MFCESLEAAPSVPIPTVTPAARSRGTGQTPDPRIMLATGACATAALWAANSSMSGSVTQTA